MKHIIILGDGMADHPMSRLGNKTLLQFADTPYMDMLARKGRTGRLMTIPALDGGGIFFLAVDAVSLLIFKRKVPEKYQAAVNTAGFVVLMGFMLLVTFHDVFKLFQ